MTLAALDQTQNHTPSVPFSFLSEFLVVERDKEKGLKEEDKKNENNEEREELVFCFDMGKQSGICCIYIAGVRFSSFWDSVFLYFFSLNIYFVLVDMV